MFSYGFGLCFGCLHAGCSLLVAGCWLLASVLAAGCWLLVAGCCSCIDGLVNW